MYIVSNRWEILHLFVLRGSNNKFNKRSRVSHMTQGTTMDYYQEIVEIGGIKIPLIHFKGNKYLPVSYIARKLLLREQASDTISRSANKNLLKFIVDYGQSGENNKQLSNCIEVNELGRILTNSTQAVRLSLTQRQSQNKLHEYLSVPLLSEMEYDTKQFELDEIVNYDRTTLTIINQTLTENPIVSGRRCSKCMRNYPLTDVFFYRLENNMDTQCIRCKQSKSYKFKSNDDYFNYLMKNDAEEYIEFHLNQDGLEMYNGYLKRDFKRLPKWIYTMENFTLIIKDLYTRGIVSKNNLNHELLQNKLRLDYLKYGALKIADVYRILFGDNFFYENWKYPSFTLGSQDITPEIAKINFDNYLREYSIVINNPFDFDYQEIIVKCGIRSVERQLGGLCGFFVYYWDGKYAGYQFRNIGNFYRWNRNNVLSDLRFLVEKDMKMQVEKIPLYVTKSSLRSIAPSLWNYIVNSKNGNIYEWFNELYPNQFDETDFEIGRYRNNFDSIEEEQVDGVLREHLKNVIYNYNNSDQVVSLKGKRPDWLVLSENGVWIIEYLGMYIESQKNNEIISSYIDSTHEKMKLYEGLKSYSTIYLYPSDLLNGFEGVRNKIKIIS